MVDYQRKIPLYTLEGVRDAEISTHYLTTEDKLGLSLFRFQRSPQEGEGECEDAVLLLHGLTTSTDMFVMPEQRNLVNFLHDHGYRDVWTLDWRGSMRHNYDLFPSQYTLDDIALYDHPPAIRRIRDAIGANKRLHVVCHCVGSISFMMSLAAGLIDGVTSVVSNSVSLTPQVPGWSRFKLTVAPFAMNWILRFPNLNPRWSYLPGPGIPQGKILSKMVSLVHQECDVPACHMISFMWGAGFPACYQHENMLPESHERVGDLFGAISMSYYRHIRKMVQAGAAVKMHPKDSRYAALPDNYLEAAAGIKTPILFMTGDCNKVFKTSNVTTYESLQKIQGGERNQLRILPGYGHQDPFMGKNNADDVFPHIVAYLDSQKG